ncbi:MAG: anti-sigma factor [Thermomicrobiales bacterium]
MSGTERQTTEHPDELPARSTSLGLECAFVDDNVEAFVLRALDLSDQQRIALHLRWCERCREVASRSVIVPRLLAESVPLEDGPSPDVRTRLMARVAEDRAASGTETPLASATQPPDASTGTGSKASRLTLWQRRILPAATAVLTIAFLLVSAWGVGLQSEIEDLRAQAEPTITFSGQPLASPRLFTTKPACSGCSGIAQLGADPGKSTGVLMAWGLDPSETHEVWCMHENGESNRVAVLDVNADGDAMQTLTFSKPIAGYLEIRIVKQNDASPELIFSPKHDMEEASNTSPDDQNAL